MAYKIQALGLGGVLDQAIAIIRDHFGLLFRIMLLLLIPFNLILGFYTLSITPQLPPDATYEEILEANEAAANNVWPLLGFGIINGLIVYPVTNAAVIQAVARLYLGQPVTAIEALKHGLQRTPALIGTTILMYLAIWGGFILLIIPGIYFAIWFGLSQHVVVLEGIAGPKSLGRSRKLVHPSRGQFLALGIVLMVIMFGINFGANFIPQPHLMIVGSTLAQAITTIIWTAALVVFYFSCRCKVENFDLQYLAEAIHEEPAASAMEAEVPARRV